MVDDAQPVAGRPIVIRPAALGATAAEFLNFRDFSGQVLAVLTDTVYLATPADEIFWLARKAATPPLHTRALIAAFDPSSLQPGLSFRRVGGGVEFQNGVRLETGSARIWNPPTLDPARVAAHPVVLARTRELAHSAAALDFGESLWRTISTVLALIDGRDIPTVSSPGLLLSAGLGPIMEAVQLYRARDLAGAMEAARPLIGLGPGLTPSGDDWVGGLLFAAASYHAAYPGEWEWLRGPVDGLLTWASTRTNRISICLLRDYARGQGPEPLHELVAGLFQAQDIEELLNPMRRLVAIGSTSGWDVAAGAMAGLLALQAPAARRR